MNKLDIDLDKEYRIMKNGKTIYDQNGYKIIRGKHGTHASSDILCAKQNCTDAKNLNKTKDLIYIYSTTFNQQKGYEVPQYEYSVSTNIQDQQVITDAKNNYGVK